MTLLLVFRATDGLLLLADGRRTRTPPGTLDTVPMTDTAQKTAVTPTGHVVAMAAGSTRFGDRYAAEIFDDAMRNLTDRPAPSVESVARACFDALYPWADEFVNDHRAVWVVVTGFDPGRSEPVTYRFTIPDESRGLQLTDKVTRDGLLCIPLLTEEDVAHLVRERFGHISVEKFLELLELDENDPRLLEAADEGYTLEGHTLEEVATEVTAAIPELIERHHATFNDSGVGGTWTMLKLRPGGSAEPETFAWGPHAVKD